MGIGDYNFFYLKKAKPLTLRSITSLPFIVRRSFTVKTGWGMVWMGYYGKWLMILQLSG